MSQKQIEADCQGKLNSEAENNIFLYKDRTKRFLLLYKKYVAGLNPWLESCLLTAI
jgi:hypothetical protein